MFKRRFVVLLVVLFLCAFSSVSVSAEATFSNGILDNEGDSSEKNFYQMVFPELIDNDLKTERSFEYGRCLHIVTIPDEANGVYVYTDGNVASVNSDSIETSLSPTSPQVPYIFPLLEDTSQITVCGNELEEFSIAEIEFFTQEMLASNDAYNANFSVEGGELTLKTSPIISFGPIKVPSSIQTFTTSFETDFIIKDLRGTQEGWRLDVSATPFTLVEPDGGFAEGTSSYQLPVGSIKLAPVSSIERIGTSSGDLPNSTLTSPTAIDDGVVTVAEANSENGMGEFKLIFPTDALQLTIDPSLIKVDRINYPNVVTPYETTITWDLVSAP